MIAAAALIATLCAVVVGVLTCLAGASWWRIGGSMLLTSWGVLAAVLLLDLLYSVAVGAADATDPEDHR